MSLKRTEKIQQILYLEQLLARNFFYFVKNFVGFSDITEQTHKPLCDFLQDDTAKRKLILMPRGTFKTSIATISYPIYRLLKNPDLRILISSDTFDNAVKCLYQIKSVYESNTKFRAFFGDLVGDKWREDEIYLSSRKKQYKEPSICCGSQDVTRVGQHYDIIILDDIVTDVNTQTKEQVRKTIEYYKSLYSILEPDGEIIVIGTRWSYDDLYGYILDNHKREFKIFLRKAIENGKAFFPERLPLEKLEELKKLQGSSMFSAQYMNEPISFEDRIFKNIHFYTSLPQKLSISITIDPAISLDNNADYTAIIVCGTDERECIYVLEYYNERLALNDLIDTIFWLNDKWKPQVIGIETVGYQKSLKYYLEMEELKRKIFLPIVELKTDTRKSKFMRLLALQPYLERGQMLLRKDMEELINQLYSYPKSTHDDLVDALSYQLQIYTIPVKNEEVVQEEIEQDSPLKLGKTPPLKIKKEEEESYVNYY